jgi:hypothetical protein
MVVVLVHQGRYGPGALIGAAGPESAAIVNEEGVVEPIADGIISDSSEDEASPGKPVEPMAKLNRVHLFHLGEFLEIPRRRRHSGQQRGIFSGIGGLYHGHQFVRFG